MSTTNSPSARHESSAIDRLIAPTSREALLTEYWEAKPLLVKRKRADYFDPLLTLNTIDEVITTYQLAHPDIQLVDASRELRAAEYTHEGGAIDAVRLYQQYARGATIIMNRLDRFVSTLSELCRSLERELSSRFQCNVYLTPGESQGLRAHYDSHDVIVAQVLGVKHWVIYDNPKVLPFRGEMFSEHPVEPGAVSMEFDLEPGDTLYLPRGIMHKAVARPGTSLHLTVGVLHTSWTDLLLEAIARLGLSDTEFRKSLPVGFAHTEFDRGEAEGKFRALLRRAVGEADFHGALDHFALDLISTRELLLRHQLDQIHRLPTVSPGTTVGARDNLMYRIRMEGESVIVTSYVGELRLPAHAADALRFALEHDRYTVADLPGDLDDDGKVVLVRRLIREGLVRQV